MIDLKQWMEVVKYRISEGGEYGWTCYGPNAHALSAWSGPENDVWSANVVFDTKTTVVYEVSVCDYVKNRAYRIIHPEHVDEYHECEEKLTCSDRFDEAWDDVTYTDLDLDEDWLEKAKAIVEGREYDTRIQMPINLSNKEFLTLAELAHESDVTLNQMIERILLEAMTERGEFVEMK
jgi:hypothetical protein